MGSRAPDATAVRATITLAIPLIVLVAIGRPELTLYPTFGAFAAVFGRQLSVSARVRTRGVVAGWLVACVAVGAAVGVSPDRTWWAVPAAAAVAVLAVVLSTTGGWVPPGPLFSVFAIAACASIPTPAARVPLAAALTAATAAISLLPDLIRMVRAADGAGSSQIAAEPVTPDVRGLARRCMARSALQSGAAVALAGTITNLVGIGHPYWGMVAAAAATTGATSRAKMTRGVHRVVGTAIGVAATAGVLAVQPGAWLTVALAIALQAIGETFVGRNYAVALMFITPLALLMAELARSQTAGTLLRDRLLETVTGAVCGFAVVGATALLPLLRAAEARKAA